MNPNLAVLVQLTSRQSLPHIQSLPHVLFKLFILDVEADRRCLNADG